MNDLDDYQVGVTVGHPVTKEEWIISSRWEHLDEKTGIEWICFTATHMLLGVLGGFRIQSDGVIGDRVTV